MEICSKQKVSPLTERYCHFREPKRLVSVETPSIERKRFERPAGYQRPNVASVGGRRQFSVAQVQLLPFPFMRRE